ncbi:hypothetical protein EYF80_027374 [Liparis tanakae]|uniref:Uncharacterized protein n=1 Tax=Liparis tanakae TaxID=230148 RepID=A0A4Z2HBI5_9TELE|nr:hypothetical protein EYF80_027374 [Liparis tanakae]
MKRPPKRHGLWRLHCRELTVICCDCCTATATTCTASYIRAASVCRQEGLLLCFWRLATADVKGSSRSEDEGPSLHSFIPTASLGKGTPHAISALTVQAVSGLASLLSVGSCRIFKRMLYRDGALINSCSRIRPADKEDTYCEKGIIGSNQQCGALEHEAV